MDIKNRSLILDFWEKVFSFLSYFSIFRIIQVFKKNITYRFVELWVIFNVLFSLVASVVLFNVEVSVHAFYYVFITYGTVRIFEIIIYQLNVLLFDPYRASKLNKVYKIKSPTRLVVLLFHNYFEIICWFTTILIGFLNMENQLSHSWGEYLKMNFFYISTFNTSAIISDYSKVPGSASIILFESLVGYVITLVTMARFIGLLPQTQSIDDV